ncbi:MAG TPA: protein kinase [Tepidiformaceae bacterium]|nr:protein kinase [Tepidiformaceae bacterium]
MKPSDVIDERYRLEALLGTGGMAEVWLADDLRLDRAVAIKVLRDGASDAHDGDLISSLDREARVIARLQHPNIVGVYDTGVFEGRHYLVMEYVQGYTLRQLLDARGRVPEPDAVRYAIPIAAALQYAHEQGVVHCDVKPENVLISEQGVPKVTDFGVAETITRTLSPEQARDIVGTIAYLAPEVIQGANADPRSDVYSLGMTLYEMIAGRLPFSGATPAAAAGQRLAMPAPPLRSFNPEASPEIEGVLAKALAISPASRFPTALEFSAALRRAAQRPAAQGYVTRQGPVAVAPPIPSRSGGVSRRNPTARVTRTTTYQELPPSGGGGISAAGMAAVLGIIIIAAVGGLVAALILTNQNSGSNAATSPTATTAATQGATATPPPPTATAKATNAPTATPVPSDTATPLPSATATATRRATATPRPTASPTAPAATATTAATTSSASPTP